MKKKSQFLLCRKKRKRKKESADVNAKLRQAILNKGKQYPREYKKHTEIITKNITINNLPTPNRFLFFGRKKQ